jgi:tRNA (adenine57-N1/adenine58-N1)-methyltransferase
MIKQNDLVLLYKDERRNYLLKVSGGRLHNDFGYIDIQNIIGKDFGDYVETNLGHKFFILKPTIDDMVMKIKRMTQILYPKEIGMILVKANIFPGARVIECGGGSGALTTALANFVRPTGKVYSYERNPEFMENARKNIERYGLTECWEAKNQEISGEFDQKEVDFVMIDIGSQWDLVPAAYKSLKGGCRVSAICPTFDQLTRTVFTMEETGFINIETMEILVRRILVRRGKTRPEQTMPSHTGWLVFGTKINQPVALNPEAKNSELPPAHAGGLPG